MRQALSQQFNQHKIELLHFGGILQVEVEAIQQRRSRINERRKKQIRSKLVRAIESQRPPQQLDAQRGKPVVPAPNSTAEKIRPQPIPRDMTGLALSGGGIR